MKKLLIATLISAATFGTQASIESKDWHDTATPAGAEFVQDTIVLDFFASPAEMGWTSEAMLADYIDLAHERGITGSSITIGMGAHNTWDKFVTDYNKYDQAIRQSETELIFVHKVEDYERAHSEGKYAVQWNNQSTAMLEGDLSRVETMADMGIKTMQLVYNGSNDAASGVIDMMNGKDGGLTEFGKKVIDEMVEHGITVDLSHNSEKTIKDILDYMEVKHPGVPMIVSHSPVASTYDCQPYETIQETESRMQQLGLKDGDKDYRLSGCYRLIDAPDAKRIADNGGVISVTFTEWMMDGIWPEDITPRQAAEMIDGAVQEVGIDHVGIASDDMQTVAGVVGFAKKHSDLYADNGYMLNAFDQGATGCGEMSKIMAPVVDELKAMGYSDEDMAKVFGGNLMRVYSQTWK
tara:strand:- start:782 stop:2008 length:1227 start_codon:yes stop_codon:yes gene_type:complete